MQSMNDKVRNLFNQNNDVIRNHLA